MSGVVSSSKTRPRNFSLKFLMFGVVVASVLMWLATQYGKVEAQFEIVSCDLNRASGGHLDGSLQWRYARVKANGNIERSDTLLTVENIQSGKMVGLKSGDQFKVRYRLSDLGPIKKENPYVLFMTQELGIEKDEIVGFIQMDGWSEVVVRGKGAAP